MTRVAIQARYSSDNQKESSIDDQVRLCRERAAAEGWDVAGVYPEYEVSGASVMLRPGIQQLVQDAIAGRFDIVLSEALDRISRDQEDVAAIFKRLKFAGVGLFTLSEGEVTELHIGLKGTMNALFLKDLSAKVKRGQRGRIELGKNGGGNSYGYDVVRQVDDRGELVRGDRVINEQEAAVVRRVFSEYVAGKSPKAIAAALNAEGIPGPSGKGWGASTIYGNWQRGTGILNNELYVGHLVWNRVSYPKNPDTGRKVARVNPQSAWVRTEVPDMRILDQDLWERAKAKQVHIRYEHSEFWQRQRPKYLFSRMLKCGCCGGGYAKISVSHYGCSAARTKGAAICDNLRSIRRDDLEHTVLSVLQERLMAPELLQEFCAEYATHINRLRMERNASLEAYRSELKRLDAQEDRMIRAIKEGYATPRLKVEMDEMIARRAEVTALVESIDEAPILLHPNMAGRYREEITRLIKSLNQDETRAEAIELIRSLVDRIVITPDRVGGGSIVDVHGDLAGIINISTGNKLTNSEIDLRQIRLVAGLTPSKDIINAREAGGGETSQASLVAIQNGGGGRNHPSLHSGRKPLEPAERHDSILHHFNIMQDKVVELRGIEPLTSSLRTTRSPN